MLTSNLAQPFNPAKLLWHRAELEAVLEGRPTKSPISVEWDVSNRCPHNCFFCSFGTNESHGYRQQHWVNFPTARALSLIPELKEIGVQAITFTGGGEPLIHPSIAQILRATTEAGLPWGLVTNGVLLRGPISTLIASHATFVRVSLDAGTDATHQIMHRPGKPQFEMILDQMTQLGHQAQDVRAVLGKPSLTMGASFCVTDQNWQEIGTAAARVKSAGGQYLEVRPTYPTDWRGDGLGIALTNVSAAIGALEDARREIADAHFQIIGMIDRFEALTSPAKGYSACQIGPLTTVIGADGRLWHCCVQRGQPGFDLGSVLEGPFADIWAKAQARRLGDSINVSKCPRCRYDNYNRLIAGLETNALHVNFV